MRTHISIPYFEIEYARDIDKVLKHLLRVEESLSQSIHGALMDVEEDDYIEGDIRDARCARIILLGIKEDFKDDPIAFSKIETAIEKLRFIQRELINIQIRNSRLRRASNQGGST
ncbi:hypothetical protein GL218_04395 [Daldinia childiae]|uniref:uncharacterized protein n=1 Tax=Daldinia childiae TaxID=326645 RepID=UPI0014457A71|nr:uncharacterized protein GL218_04395 [Daldinia childiae]KAF3059950.1 hypothetical protein GL218_04395 [Daldinia childiae]